MSTFFDLHLYCSLATVLLFPSVDWLLSVTDIASPIIRNNHPLIVPNHSCCYLSLSTPGRIRHRKELSLLYILQRWERLRKLLGLLKDVLRKRHQLVSCCRTFQGNYFSIIDVSKNGFVMFEVDHCS